MWRTLPPISFSQLSLDFRIVCKPFHEHEKKRLSTHVLMIIDIVLTHQANDFEFTPLDFVKLISLFHLSNQTNSFFCFSFKGFDILFHPLHTNTKVIKKIICFLSLFETGSQSVDLSNLDLKIFCSVCDWTLGWKICYLGFIQAPLLCIRVLFKSFTLPYLFYELVALQIQIDSARLKTDMSNAFTSNSGRDFGVFLVFVFNGESNSKFNSEIRELL